MFPVNIVHWQVDIKNETYVTFYNVYVQSKDWNYFAVLTNKASITGIIMSLHNLPVKFHQPYSIIDWQLK